MLLPVLGNFLDPQGSRNLSAMVSELRGWVSTCMYLYVRVYIYIYVHFKCICTYVYIYTYIYTVLFTDLSVYTHRYSR